VSRLHVTNVSMRQHAVLSTTDCGGGFCPSLGDTSDNELPDERQVDLLALIGNTPDRHAVLLSWCLGAELRVIPAGVLPGIF
jgi:hypothetical protein